jgi:uncharacterized phage-associated protein
MKSPLEVIKLVGALLGIAATAFIVYDRIFRGRPIFAVHAKPRVPYLRFLIESPIWIAINMSNDKMPIGYDVRKAAQVVAFLIQEQGGTADMIKTIKLAYLSDRRFLDLYGRPLLNDDLYCLDHGPIDSTTLDYIKGSISNGKKRSVWAEYVTPVDPTTYQFSIAKNDIYFGELSEAEEQVLRDVVKEFKNMKPFELVDWIHENCREWVNPRGTSTYLSYAEVFKALGKDHPSKRVKYVEKVRRLAAATHTGA